MSVRVFVSHSTGQKQGLASDLQNQAHRTFRRNLCERLHREEGIEPFVDDEMPSGTHWREHLFGKLAECNAALILVNEPALYHSPWVDTEARILAWRAWLDRTAFRLILIHFGGITRTRIAEHRDWEAIAPAEILMLPRSGDSLDIDDPAAVQQAMDAVVATLRTLPDEEAVQRSSSGWILSRLASLLSFDRDTLAGLAKLLEVSIPDGANEAKFRRALAQRLYERGPAGLRTLRECPSAKLDRNEQLWLLDLLGTYWVHPGASASILKFRHRGAPSQVFAINGALSYFTPDIYVEHVCRSQSRWPVITVATKVPLDQILEQVREDLKERFNKALALRRIRPDRARPDEIDEALKEIIAELLDADEPVFVALPPAGARDKSVVEGLTRRYGDIRIILCGGHPPGASPLLDVETLQPELDLLDEKQAFKAYQAMLVGIR
jgi:hypothetical protein